MFLKVDSAYPEDQGGGKARLDPDTMLQLRLSPGDLIYIEGKRRTVAKVWRMMVNDWNQGKIRIDSFTRANAEVSIGDRVQIAKVTEEIEAERILLALQLELDLPGEGLHGAETCCIACIVDIFPQAADPVPAHLRFALVRLKEAHLERGCGGP
jgi:hypothetical protein